MRLEALTSMNKKLLCACGHPLVNHLVGSSGKPTGACRFCDCEGARYKEA